MNVILVKLNIIWPYRISEKTSAFVGIIKNLGQKPGHQLKGLIDSADAAILLSVYAMISNKNLNATFESFWILRDFFLFDRF